MDIVAQELMTKYKIKHAAQAVAVACTCAVADQQTGMTHTQVIQAAPCFSLSQSLSLCLNCVLTMESLQGKMLHLRAFLSAASHAAHHVVHLQGMLGFGGMP